MSSDSDDCIEIVSNGPSRSASFGRASTSTSAEPSNRQHLHLGSGSTNTASLGGGSKTIATSTFTETTTTKTARMSTTTTTTTAAEVYVVDDSDSDDESNLPAMPTLPGGGQRPPKKTSEELDAIIRNLDKGKQKAKEPASSGDGWENVADADDVIFGDVDREEQERLLAQYSGRKNNVPPLRNGKHQAPPPRAEDYGSIQERARARKRGELDASDTEDSDDGTSSKKKGKRATEGPNARKPKAKPKGKDATAPKAPRFLYTDEQIAAMSIQQRAILRKQGVLDPSDDEDEAPAPKKRKTNSGTTGKAKVSAEEKEAKKLEAAAAKEEKKREADALKAQKKAFVDANLVRGSSAKRSETARELTLHLGGKAFEREEVTSGKGKTKEPTWKRVATLLEEKMKEEYSVNVVSGSGTNHQSEGVLIWKRLCDKKWIEERRLFLPFENNGTVTAEEDVRVVFMEADEVSRLVAAKQLLPHLERVKKSFVQPLQLFVLFYGLNTLYRQFKVVANRIDSVNVKQQMGRDPKELTEKQKTVGIGQGQPKREEIELEIMRAQVSLNLKFIHVDKDEEAAEWIEVLSVDVGQKPYQRVKNLSSQVLGTGGAKVQSGKDDIDTFEKMLQSVKGVSQNHARAIVGKYGSIRSLYDAWDRCGSTAEAKKMLTGIPLNQLVTGAATNRTFGATVSEKVWVVLNSKDPKQLIG